MKRVMLIVLACLAISIASQAQTPTTTLQVGDSVWVNPDTTHYMTGEKISPWVYKVNHAIQQIGSVFHPNGVLLQGIKSWVHQSALLGARATTKVTEEETATAPVVEEIAEEIAEETAPVLQEATPAAEETAPVVEEATPVAEETAPVAEKAVETPATEQAGTPATVHPTRLVGRILSVNKEAIKGATITLANQGYTTTTNENGEFSLTYLDAIDEEVILEANGYMSDIILVALADGQLNTLGEVLLQTDFVQEAK